MVANKSDKPQRSKVKLPFSEAELLRKIDGHSVHADELAKPQAHELERLQGLVKKYERHRSRLGGIF